MSTRQRASLLLAGAVVALVAITGERAYTQAERPNSAANPERAQPLKRALKLKVRSAFKRRQRARAMLRNSKR